MKQAMELLDKNLYSEAYNILFDAFWSETPPPAAESGKRRENPAERDLFAAPGCVKDEIAVFHSMSFIGASAKAMLELKDGSVLTGRSDPIENFGQDDLSWPDAELRKIHAVSATQDAFRRLYQQHATAALKQQKNAEGSKQELAE
ncbi:hypothetical protein HNP33_003072 [Comamonas odontotermitis]|uniref:Uncharacterized protein n=1 Tax=Comamonas odontotermitis TaxID=379895 RepID=A0ABR6RII5_9BURK|nr:hypothetical protein [Comamonas odontotermitis]MBB6578967.1 hypothetical protein [Comamonas odontotermitis]